MARRQGEMAARGHDEDTDKAPVCAFGRPWPHGQPCRACRAYAEALDAAFWRGVLFGDWDADGYTTSERKRRSSSVEAIGGERTGV